ncbi:DEAD_2 domain protein [Caldithrix abyssi DSM 13497]|uniref:DNA 5'-3' helicase n=1 Tax=Caldithrix abyssi DSM 13497 TaxID=880073 RepID=H1XU08_CALAY|nr:ATP-dependent DNA helicase [Caldithrix abyssi]APF16900.1 Rad3-related DNA helicase [Caldithrix abyssi DSM 13497]EHO40451.1 DEAD_2 domain protein [Caldithrix abyssi DSM 13497]
MAIRIENNDIYLAVRDLVHYPPDQPLISSFPLPQRGVLGQKAHRRVQESKQKHFGLFHREFTVNRAYAYRDFTFHIQGRIDGVYQLSDRMEIEEIKSVILRPAEFKRLQIERYPHFSEQLLFYAYLLQDSFDGLEVQTFLILVNLINNQQRSFPIVYNRMQVERMLQVRFEEIVQRILDERQKLAERQALIRKIQFDLPEERPQQQMMMDEVRQALESGAHLMASAPTGTGKTAAALYPAIRHAYLNNKKIFFITSKTTQQRIAVETVLPLIAQGLPLKAMVITASEKMCLNDVFFCHPSFCPYIKDYNQRLLSSNLLPNLLANDFIDPAAISSAAAGAQLCPFEVSMDLLAHVDLIIGDYNYVFDPAAQLRRLFMSKDFSDWILIIDEAHNLYERGMNYLSPQIERRKLAELIAFTAQQRARVYRDLTSGLKEFKSMLDQLQREGELNYEHQQYFLTQLDLKQLDEAFKQFEAAFIRYLIYKIRAKKLIVDDPLEAIFYQLRRFVRVAHIEDRAFVAFFNAMNDGVLHIQCCDPSHYLGEIIDRFHGVIAMSATLDPMEFYRNLLGFSAVRTRFLQLDSPFPLENRKLIIVPGISTRYKDRLRNAPKIAEIIRNTISVKPGNYLVFFPSFEFLQLVNVFLNQIPGEKIIQKPGMKAKERDETLDKLRAGQAPHLLMAVMGGIFSEGVDFSGNMAIGVIVIGPALPQVSFERELLRQYYEETYHMGEEYAYIYPGMNKVIQAVGRLIRSATDKGVVLLIGDRFADERFNLLLPDYWFRKEDDVEITSDYLKALKNFWQKMDRAD